MYQFCRILFFATNSDSSPRGLYQNYSSTICTWRLIMLSNNLDGMERIFTKHNTTNRVTWDSSISNISSDCTNTNFNLSQNLLVMYINFVYKWRTRPGGISMGNKRILHYSYKPHHLINKNSLPHSPPSLMHILWRGE